jgi:hypothetical protein
VQRGQPYGNLRYERLNLRLDLIQYVRQDFTRRGCLERPSAFPHLRDISSHLSSDNMNSFLQVVDFSFSDALEPTVLITYTPDPRTPPTMLQIALAGLPPQTNRCCRLYITQGLESNNEFASHLSQLITPEFAMEIANPVGSASLVELLSQCRTPSISKWWQFDTYLFHFLAGQEIDDIAEILPCSSSVRVLQGHDGHMICTRSL